MDMMTGADLPLLTEADPAAVQISMFMPTHRSGDESRADQLRWKNLLGAVRDRLSERLKGKELDELLAPAQALQEDSWQWQHMRDGVALFMRPGWYRSYSVPAAVPELATIGDRLVLGPALRLLTGNEQFLLLALSQQDTRLFRADRHGIDAVDLHEVPTSLREVVGDPEPRSDTLTRPAAAGAGAAVFFGHGASDKDFKKDEMVSFLRDLAAGLRTELEDDGTRMVLAGLEPIVSAYRGISEYQHVLDEAVLRNPDPLSKLELHELAWPIIEQQLSDERSRLVGQFRELQGTGRASSDPDEVHEAAVNGRVETLFVQADPWCWEQETGDPHAIVMLGEDQRYAACEQIEAAAVATMNNGGLVHATSDGVDADSSVAAVFRY